MAHITTDHPFAPHLGVTVDGQVLDGAIVEADSDAGTVLYHTREKGQFTSDRTLLLGEVRFFTTCPYIKRADVEREFPELASVMVDNPTSY